MSRHRAQGINIAMYNEIIGLPWWFNCKKNPPAMQGTWVRSLGQEDSLEKAMATHSSILAWREEPGGLQCTGSHRVRHD